jgi:hypothetical protein
VRRGIPEDSSASYPGAADPLSGTAITLVVVRLEGEYGGAAWTDSRVLALNRQLEILRVDA